MTEHGMNRNRFCHALHIGITSPTDETCLKCTLESVRQTFSVSGSSKYRLERRTLSLPHDTGSKNSLRVKHCSI